MHDTSRHALTRQRGFSMVELMVAMTVSIVLIGGALSVLYSTKVSYLTNERTARLQENGRAAFELILRDLRGAGFPGCAQAVPGVVDFTNTLNLPNSLLWNFGSPLEGFEATGGNWQPALNAALVPQAVPGNDIIAVRTSRSNNPVFRTTALVNPNDPITIRTAANQELPQDGDTLLINDCDSMAVFRLSGAPAVAGATATLNRLQGPVSGDLFTPTNATDDLGSAFAPDAQVAEITTVIYYLRESTAGTGPALWRVRPGIVNGAEEVVEGIEGLQILYGVDLNNDAVIDNYVAANAVGAANWNTVLNVQVAILARSPEENAPDPNPGTFTLLDTVLGPFNDRFERTVFSTTVNLRNRTN